jgi:hypothetical protein
MIFGSPLTEGQSIHGMNHAASSVFDPRGDSLWQPIFWQRISFRRDGTAAPLWFNLTRNCGVVRASGKVDAKMAVATHDEAPRIAH